MGTLLKEKVCCITGASRGIGKAAAMRFAEEGAIVYAVARSNDLTEAWVSQSMLQTSVIPIALDITDSAGVKALLMRIRKEHGRLDVLVNNAAVEKNECIGTITLQSMRDMFEVNVFAMIELIQLAARVMQRGVGGSIINLASGVGLRGNPGQLVYSATKGAVIALTKTAAKELAPTGIRVNAVAPGLTNTEMLSAVDEKYLETRLKNIYMGRPAEPEEIADAILFLSSHLSRYISGQVLGVDGCAVL